MSYLVFFQVTRATLACARPIALRATAALAISGPKSANQCWGRERCAPSRGKKALTAWKSSSAVTAPRASPARCGKTPPPYPSPDSTCARRSEAGAAAVSDEASSVHQWRFFLRKKKKENSGVVAVFEKANKRQNKRWGFKLHLQEEAAQAHVHTQHWENCVY